MTIPARSTITPYGRISETAILRLFPLFPRLICQNSAKIVVICLGSWTRSPVLVFSCANFSRFLKYDTYIFSMVIHYLVFTSWNNEKTRGQQRPEREVCCSEFGVQEIVRSCSRVATECLTTHYFK